jgi:HEAT repeat protein/energy-coupling factor transporter ATP-binding protein EcfA2
MTLHDAAEGPEPSDLLEYAIHHYLRDVAKRGANPSSQIKVMQRAPLDSVFIPLKVIEIQPLQYQNLSELQQDSVNSRDHGKFPGVSGIRRNQQFPEDYYRPIADYSRPAERAASEHVDRDSGSKAGKVTDKQSINAYIASHRITLYQALSRCEHLVLLGESGSGKSTLLEHLAKDLAASDHSLVPVFVSLGKYAENLGRQSSLLDFAITQIISTQPPVPGLKEALRNAHDIGRIVWLLDGLDETGRSREDILARLPTLKGKVAVSSRPDDTSLWHRVSQYLTSVHYYTVSSLAPHESDQIIQNWYQAIAPGKNETADWVSGKVRWLTKELDQRPRLAELVRNPLFLTLLLDRVDKDPNSALPENRADLYESYLNALIDWEVERSPVVAGEPAFSIGGLNKSESVVVVKRAFTAIGWSLFLSGPGRSATWRPTHATVIEHIAKFFLDHHAASADSLAKDSLTFWERTGLIERLSVTETENDVKWEGELLGLPHLSLLEFATGRMLRQQWESNQQETWGFLEARLQHPDWREPILFMVSLLSESAASDFISRLTRGTSRYERDLKRDFALALDCIASGANVADRVLKKTMSEWARLARDHTLRWLICVSTPYVLILALLATLMIGIGTTSVLLPLFVCAGLLLFKAIFGANGYWLKRILTLGGRLIGYPHPRLSLIRQAGRLSEPRARKLVVVELTRLVNEYGPPERESMLSRNSRFWFRERMHDERQRALEAALEALGELGDPKAVQVLVNYSRDSVGMLRKSSAQALEKLTRAATPALIDVVQGGSYDYAAKEAAAFALGEIQDPSAILPLLKLCDEDSDHFETVTAALEKIGDTRTLLSQYDPNNHRRPVKEIVIKYLGTTRDPQAKEVLLKLLDDKDENQDESIHCAAVDALANLGTSDVVPELLNRISSYRSHSFWWWDFIGSTLPAHIGSALQKLNAEDTTLERLLQVLESKYSELDARPAAAIALGYLGDLRAIPGLKRALRLSMIQLLDENSFVFYADRIAIACAFGLAQLGDVSAVGAIVQAIEGVVALKQKRRYSGASNFISPMLVALAKIGASSSQVCSLLTQIFDEEIIEGYAAIVALGQLKCETAVPLLVAKLQDPETPYYNPKKLATALIRIGTEQAVAAVIRRQAAATSVGDQGLYYDIREGIEVGIKTTDAHQLVQSLKVALTSSNVLERWQSIYWLGELKQSEAVSALHDVLRADSDEGVRIVAAASLAKIGNEDAIDALIEVIEKERSEIRSRCVHQLCEINNPNVVRGLELLLFPTNDHVPISFGNVPSKIGRFQRLLMLAEIVGVVALEIVGVVALEFVHWSINFPSRYRGITSREPDSVDLRPAPPRGQNSLRNFAESLKTLWARLSCLQIRFRRAGRRIVGNCSRLIANWIEHLDVALTKSPQYSEEDVVRFLEELHDNYVGRRVEAARQLGYVTHDDVVTGLEKALSDPNWRVRWVASRSIRRIIVIRARQSFREFLQNSLDFDFDLNLTRAVEALKKINTLEAARVLKRALQHSNPKVRATAAGALGDIDHTQGVAELLVEAVSDKSSDVRHSAVYVLRKFADESSIPVLLKALYDKSAGIRLNAAVALGKASESCEDSERLANIPRKLWWQLAEWVSAYAGADVGLETLERVVSRTEFLASGSIKIKVPWFASNAPIRNSFTRNANTFAIALGFILAMTLSSIINNLLTDFVANAVPSLKTPGINTAIFLVVLVVLSGLLMIVFQKLIDRFYHRS